MRNVAHMKRSRIWLQIVQAKARLFQTDPQQEINFLNLLKNMQDMADIITVSFAVPRNS